MNSESISLYKREGSSDKEYHIDLVVSDEGCRVNFRYGRRGSTLKPGAKTQTPVSYEEAKSIYDGLSAEKMKKGYSPGEEGNSYQQTPLAESFSGILPQLLNPVEEEELETLILDSQYAAQEKKDGKRCLIRKQQGVIEGINRRGLVIALPQTIEKGILDLVSADSIIDGELVGKVFFAFDLLEIDGESIRDRPFNKRYLDLTRLFSAQSRCLRIIPMVQGTASKRELLLAIKAQRGEGIVLKQLNAPYTAGRPASGGTQRKFKFTAFATCRVRGHHSKKRSVFLEVADGDQWIGVGKVQIPSNHAIPKVGSLCEVEYLYAYKGGSLFQSVYHGERDDLEQSAAVITQLKYKAESSEADEEQEEQEEAEIEA